MLYVALFAFMLMFNVWTLPLMFFWGLFSGHVYSKVFMLTLLIFFWLVYVLVRVCLGCWGYILKQSFLCSLVSLSWFPQSPTPVSTPNTCMVTGVKKQTNIKLGGTISRGDFPNNKSPGSLCAEIFFGSTIVFTMDFAVHPIYGCLKKGWYHKKKY